MGNRPDFLAISCLIYLPAVLWQRREREREREPRVTGEENIDERKEHREREDYQTKRSSLSPMSHLTIRFVFFCETLISFFRLLHVFCVSWFWGFFCWVTTVSDICTVVTVCTYKNLGFSGLFYSAAATRRQLVAFAVSPLTTHVSLARRSRFNTKEYFRWLLPFLILSN